jgi:spore coat protein CotH
MAAMLPENQRNDLTSIYRSLKLEAMKLKIGNDSLMSYLNEIKSTFTEFFNLAFPERGGKMYSNYGTHLSHDMRSMVLNTQF